MIQFRPFKIKNTAWRRVCLIVGLPIHEAGINLRSFRTQAPDSWRPIETAPKDGVIVGWGEYRERDGFSPAFMRHYESCGWSVNAMPFYPTHWMPLPAAPALRPQTAESGE